MSQAPSVSSSGLEGVVVADTALSEVDGNQGRLILRGHSVEALAGKTSFESVCGLLWTGELGPETTRRAREAVARGRVTTFERLPHFETALQADDVMVALQGCLALFPRSRSKPEPEDAELTGAVAVCATAWARRQAGLEVIGPSPDRTHAEDVLWMLDGREPSQARVKGLDTYLTTVIDHGMNASTFTARVVASTGSDLTSAIVAAIGALKGPLHGGAPGPVLDMLDAIGSPSQARTWLENEVLQGRRIMGLGHRVYRVRDPRAAVLESGVEGFEQRGENSERLALARVVEKEAESILTARHPDRPIRANVEFYTAVLLEAVGLSRDLFSGAFAMGRVAGWCAHVREQRAVGRLIRPQSHYVGPPESAPSVKL